MPVSSRKVPVLDVTRISFPSDAITVKAARDALNAEGSFDHHQEKMFEGLEACVITERDIAHRAFNAALKGIKPHRTGKQAPQLAWERREMVTGMDSEYQRFGISSGPKQTVELIRRIESQAVAQAQELMGQGR